VKYGEILGKKVIDKKARLLGKVYEVEINVKDLKITNFYLDVDKDAVNDLGLKKPMIGSVKAIFPTEMVDAISDSIILNGIISELKNIIKPLS
jgi:sporulation protein YlmC with PRC-barrel domain